MFRKLFGLFDFTRDPEPDALAIADQAVAKARKLYWEAQARKDTRDVHRYWKVLRKARSLQLAAEMEHRRA